MKPVDVKSSTYTDSIKEINDKDPKFKVGDIVRVSKQKNIFARSYVRSIFPNSSEEVFVIKKVKNTVLWISKSNKLLECFMKKNYKKQIKKSLELKK